MVIKSDSYVYKVSRHTRPMWVALDKKNRIAATWYRGCVQSFNSWRIAVRSLGYHPHKVTVVFPW